MMSWQSHKWITLIIYQQGKIILKREQNPEFISIYHSETKGTIAVDVRNTCEVCGKDM